MYNDFNKGLSVINEARKRGILLFLDKEKVMYRLAGQDNIDHLFISEIAKYKNEIKILLNDRKSLDEAPDWTAITATRLDGSPISPSFGQERIWFIHQLEGSIHYHIPLGLRLSGTLDPAALDAAFRNIILRHEVLRTVIIQQDGIAKQMLIPPDNWQITHIDGRDVADNPQRLRQTIADLVNTPFDLAADYMLRVHLLDLGISSGNRHEYFLLINFHHIAADGASFNVLIRELNEGYIAHLEGRQPSLAPLPIQYADYAIWQRQWLQGETLESRLRYWRDKLQDLTPLDLPSDFPRPAIQSTRGSSLHKSFEPGLVKELQTLTRSAGATLFMTMLAAFKVLLARYSNQQDICIGCPVTGRTLQETEAIIGYFVNTLALRSDLSGNPSFRDLIASVKNTTLEAYNHQQVPFEKIVESIVSDRDLSRSPIFQVLFTLQNPGSGPSLKWPQLSFSHQPSWSNHVKFDITCTISASQDSISCNLIYCTDLFRQESIERMLDHYHQLLLSIVANPDLPIGLLKMITKKEEQILQEQYSFSRVPYPRDQTITRLFETQAAISPDAIALVAGLHRYSYRQLMDRSRQLGRYLRSRGILQGQMIGIAVDRSAEMIIGILGILSAGAAFVPIHPQYPPDQIAFVLDDIHCTICLSNDLLKDKMTLLKNNIELIDLTTDMDLIEQVSDQNGLPTPQFSATDLAYVIYTSGSTGRPKGVMIEHRALIDHLYGVIHSAGLDACMSFALIASLVADAGYSMLFSALILGKTTHVLSEDLVLNGRLLQQYLEKERIDCIKIVPSLWRSYTDDQQLPLPVKKIIFGGEALPPALPAYLSAAGFMGDIYNHYGPTEASIGKTICRIDPSISYVNVPIGRPFSNTAVHILDSHGNRCPIGIAGEILIGGEGLARGYLNRPDLTAEKFIADPFSSLPNARLYRTGDLGRWLPDGNIVYLGRIDEQLKIRGFRIEPGEIENAIQQTGLVKQNIILAQADKSGNKRLVAYIVPEQNFDRESLLSSLQNRLPAHMIPAIWVSLDAMPLTRIGKIDKRALPEADSGELPGSAYMAPSGPMESALANIWQDLLGIERIGVKDNFFALGGHSLLAMRLVSAIRKQLQCEIPIRDIFQCPTIATLAALLQQKQGAERPPILSIHNRPEQIPLSFSQERLWFIHQLEGSTHYHIPWALRLKGALDLDALNAAFRGIVKRHEILRTVINQHEDISSQQIISPDDWQITRIDCSAYDRNPQQLRQSIADLVDKPFDLTADYTLRVHLLDPGASAGNEYQFILLMVLHHIAADGWSWDIIIRELNELYSAHIQKRQPVLPPLPIQYADYAIWQRQWLQGPVLDNMLRYWREKLKDLTPLDLPSDFPRPAIQSTRGASSHKDLERGLVKGLHTLSQTSGCTLFMTMLAAFKVLLYRYSGQQDICIGCPIAGRTQQEAESLIGYFVNTLTLRTDLGGNPSFRQLIDAVKNTTLEAYDHQQVPFEKVVEAIASDRDISRSPLFQVMFSIQNPIGDTAFKWPDISFSHQPAWGDSVKFDITCTIIATQDSISCDIAYCVDLFKQETIERMLDHYHTLLHAIIDNPDLAIDALPIITKKEELILLQHFNDTARPYPQDKTLVDLFLHQAALTPNATALICNDKKLSYRQLDQRSNQLGHYLRRLDIREDCPVAICIDRSIDMVTGIMGILKAGAAYVPIDPDYPTDRIHYMLSDTGARVLIAGSKTIGLIPPDFRGRIINLDLDWDKIAAGIGTAPATYSASGISTSNLIPPLTGLNPDHLAYIIYTSGSTGKPKGVMIRHSSLVNFLLSMSATLDADPGMTMLSVTSFSFDISYLEWFLPLLSGGRLILVDRATAWDGSGLRSQLALHLPTHMQATPAGWQILLDAGWKNPEELTMLIGGESVKEEIKDRLTRLGTVWNLYGPTETTIWSTCTKLDKDRPVNIGKPIANTIIYIANIASPSGSPTSETRPTETQAAQPQSSGTLCPIGIPGEICIGGDGLAKGYWQRPELTTEKFIPDPFSSLPDTKLYRTGDLGRWLPDGNIECLGRLDSQVKIHGYRIEPGEIESVAQQSGLVTQCVVTAGTDKAGHKRLLAYYISMPEFDPDKLLAFLREHLPEYMVPAIWIKMDAFPLTGSGKIDRKALPASAPEITSQKPYTAPRSDLERMLAEIWQDILKIDRASIHDNFFALGGHSLIVFPLINTLRKKNLPLQFKDLFKHQTIEKLAAYISTLQPSLSRESLQLSAEPKPLQANPCIHLLNDTHDKTPIFILPGAPGLSDAYEELARTFGSSCSIYGVQLIGLNPGEKPLQDFVETATHARLAIQQTQPRGPYRFFGHSIGAHLAYEISRQLEQLGETVDSVTILDASTDIAGVVRIKSGLTIDQGLIELTRSLFTTFNLPASPSDAELATLQTALEASAENDLEAKAGLIIGYMTGKISDNENRPFIIRALYATIFQTQMIYYPEGKIQARIIVVRALEEDWSDYDESLGWQLHSDAVLTISSPGKHMSLIYDKNAMLLQSQLIEQLHLPSL